jgi:hypothetical protein
MQTFFYIFFLFIYSAISQIDLPQSHIFISDFGYYFKPIQIGEWLNDMFVSSLEECIHQCNQDPLCRTFDYNVQPNWCRLFEVEPSPEQIIHDLSLISQLGYVQLFSDLYSAFNQTCERCIYERYLICIDDSCQCPWNTFWNGLICQKQKYAGSFCISNNECWTNIYNLTCNLGNICTSAGLFLPK